MPLKIPAPSLFGPRRAPPALLALLLAWTSGQSQTVDAADPFSVATQGMARCPSPSFAQTAAELANQSHYRAERGTSCYLSGRCRLANSYLYDKEIVPRVVLAITAAATYQPTSVWVLGSRRWVYLKGCVESDAQRASLEALVKNIDDVEAVVNELMVGTDGRPPYKTDTPG